jgi:peptidoglycan/LPS O-acetylase OafA/YrhL
MTGQPTTRSAPEPAELPGTGRDLSDSFALVVRGLAALFVVAGMAWLLFPSTYLDDIRPLDGLFRSGNIGITALFTVTGFVLTKSLSAGIEERGRTAVAGVMVRYLVGVVAFLALAVVVVWLVSVLDSTDTYSAEVTRESLFHVYSLDWNNYVREHPLSVRADLVGLWYFSVEAQLALVLAAVLLVFGRHRRVLLVLLVAGLVALTWWRWYLMDVDGWFQAGLRTDARADAFVYGVVAALVVRQWAFRASTASSVAGGAALLYLGLVISSSYASITDFYQGQSAATAIATALLLGAASVADGHGRVFDLPGVPVLADLGRSWMAALVLSGPVLYTLARNSVSWNPSSRTLVGVAILAGGIYVVDQVLRPLVTVALEALAALRTRASGAPPARSDPTEAEGHQMTRTGEPGRDRAQ